MTLADRLSLAFTDVGSQIKAILARLLPSGGGAGYLLAKSTAADFAVTWVAPGYPSTLTKTTSNQATASTTLAAISGLTAPLAANATYRFEAWVPFQSSLLTVGATVGFAGPTGSAAIAEIGVPVSAATLNSAASTRVRGQAGSATATTVLAVATQLVAKVEGIITTGVTAGNLVIQFASSGITGTITTLAGATLFVEKIG